MSAPAPELIERLLQAAESLRAVYGQDSARLERDLAGLDAELERLSQALEEQGVGRTQLDELHHAAREAGLSALLDPDTDPAQLKSRVRRLRALVATQSLSAVPKRGLE